MLSKTKKYSEERSLKLYAEYTIGGVAVDELIDSVIPLIDETIAMYVRDPEEATGEHEISALEHVYDLLREKEVPARELAFTAFIRTCVRRSACRTSVSLGPQVFDLEYNCVDTKQVDDMQRVEQKIYIEQAMKSVRKRVTDSIRFGGGERQVCEAALSCFISGSTDVSAQFLAARFVLPEQRVTSLIAYTHVLFREAYLHELSSNVPRG